MNNWRAISQIAVIFGIVSIIFAAISAFLNYHSLTLQYQSFAPIEFIQVNVLSAMLPFLLFAVLSFVVAAVGARTTKETADKEAATEIAS